MLAKLTFVALAAVGSVVAQDFPIDVNKVEPATRAAWCNAQYSSCGTLCGGTPSVNNCTANTLTYACTCNNGSAPGLKYYDNTMPTFICKEAFGQCNALNAGNAAGQRNCTVSIDDKCGKLNISQFATGPANSPSSSGGAGPSPTQSGGGSSPSPTGGAGTAGAPRNFEQIGNTAAVVALAAFAYLL